MVVIMYLAVFMIVVGAVFLIIFLSAVKNGQFEDMETPAHRMLLDDTVEESQKTKVDQEK